MEKNKRVAERGGSRRELVVSIFVAKHLHCEPSKVVVTVYSWVYSVNGTIIRYRFYEEMNENK